MMILRAVLPLLAALCAAPCAGHATNLNLSGYRLTFDDEFNHRSISQSGIGTVWSDIRPFSRYDAESDIGFGKSSFLDVASGYDPFNVDGGGLTITGIPYTVRFGYPGSWQSGLLHTRQSFTQTYGYFEMRARFNNVAGTWPAFWLLPVTTLHPTGRDPSLWQELDVVEQYGAYPQGVYSAVHTTQPSPKNVSWNFFSSHPEVANGYHTYGMDWEADKIGWYVDGVLMGTTPTPDDMNGPMYMLVDLARDGAYPSNAAAMSMNVDYIRAYSKNPKAVAVMLDAVSPPDGVDPGLYGAQAASRLPADVLSLSVYEDAYKGDCEFTVGLDGMSLGGVYTATARSTAPQTFNIGVALTSGTHVVDINFLNDLYEGLPTKDRNLYVNGIAIDNARKVGWTGQYSGGDKSYIVSVP